MLSSIVDRPLVATFRAGSRRERSPRRGTSRDVQGPSELGASGKLVSWDRSQELGRITVPTLTVGARHDTMDPAHMEWMAAQLPNGRYLYCPDGRHLAMYDDQQIYMRGIVQFLHDVDAAR